MEQQRDAQLPLAGLKVIDCATVIAGPLIGTFMADFGADVIKVQHPVERERLEPEPRPGGMDWKRVQRNKVSITLNLSKPRGQELLKALVRETDILIENFRPGVMERWGLGWDDLRLVNPRLVMVRVTGFGQYGPYSPRAGFGTIAEAMSGFAYVTGQPDAPPTLPPFALADSVAASFGCWAAMFAIYHRDVHGTGRGQFIDLSLYEPLLFILGDQSTNYARFGIVQERVGNRSVHQAPRGTFKTGDGRWVALSGGHAMIFERVLRLVGGEEAARDPRFQTREGRLANYDEIDRLVGGWIGARTYDEVMEAFQEAGAAIGPVYSIADLFQDPQVQARGDILTIQDPDWGQIAMPGVFPKLSATPGAVRWTGRVPGADNEEVFLGRLGLSREELRRLEEEGIV